MRADPRARVVTEAAVWLLCVGLAVCIAMTNIVMGVLSGLLAVWLLVGDRSGWASARTPALAGLGLYCAAAGVCALRGLRPEISLPLALKDLHKIWVLTILLVTLAECPAPRAYLAFGASFSVMAVFGVYQAFSQRFGDSWMRAHGFSHAVTYGEQFALAWLGGLCFFNRREAGTDTPASRRVGGFFLLLAGVALAFNQTRGAFLGLIAGFGAACWLYQPLRRWAAALAGGLLMVLLAWQVIPMGGRSLSRLRGQSAAGVSETLFGGRRILWPVAWKMFRDHPWTGVGPGNYRTVFTRYFQGSIERESVWGSAHNLYLHQLAERGLLGFAALIVALGALTVRAYRRAARDPNPWNLWALAALAAFLVMNLSEVAFQNEQVTALVLMIWAWSEANVGKPERRPA